VPTPAAPGQAQPSLAGKAATVYINAYDQESYAKSKVSPELYVVDSSGSFLVDGATASSVNTVVGERLAFYGAGNNYYTDKLEYTVPNEAPVVNLKAHKIAAEASMKVTGYDRTGSIQLTPDDDAENNADYSMTLGANQEEIFFLELENQDDQSVFNLKAVCLFWNNDISEVTVEDADWQKAGMPKEIRDQKLTFINDGNEKSSGNYKECYVYKKGTDEVISLHEWDRYKLKFKVKASTNNPIPNQFNDFGAIFLDASYYKGSDQKVYFDYYTHDINEKVTSVGLAETISSPEGLQIGAMIEAL
jgi:hypothetical protein